MEKRAAAALRKDKLGASNTSLRLDVLRTVQKSLEVLMIAIQEDKRSDLMKWTFFFGKNLHDVS